MTKMDLKGNTIQNIPHETDSKPKRKNTKNKKKLLKWLFLFPFALLLLILIYSLIEPYLIQIKETDIIDNDIPASFNGTKIVFVSDIHHGPAYSLKQVHNLVNKINLLNAEIILLGGDYVNKSPKYIEPFFNEFSNLKAPMGIYAVLGNHDHWESAELSNTNMKKAGITKLDNLGVWISKGKDRIRIGGVGDYYEDTQDLDKTIDEAFLNDFVVLLSHNPDYVEKIATNKVDWVLSGHTHGGQVTLFGLWAPFVPSFFGQKYRTGIVETNNTKVLVSNGLGNVGYYPIRLFARPQIHVITLYNTK